MGGDDGRSHDWYLHHDHDDTRCKDTRIHGCKLIDHCHSFMVNHHPKVKSKCDVVAQKVEIDFKSEQWKKKKEKKKKDNEVG